VAVDDLVWADVDAVIALLKAAGVTSVDIDPAKVNPPGVVVEVLGLATRVSGLTVRTRLVLIVGNQAMRKAAQNLAELFNLVKPVGHQLGADLRNVTTATYVKPGSSSPLPALLIPLDINTRQEP
jgi:hypothetical protein